jgi:putative oxidoreductase
MKLGFTAFRAVIGATLFAHGAQKLFGWFGGYGLEATGQAFEGMGLKPGKRMALVAGASEAGGGALHGEKGFFITEGGFEYNLAIIAAAVAIADHGPGPISLDRAFGTEAKGSLVALAALAAGLAGPQLVKRLSAGGGEPAPVTPAREGAAETVEQVAVAS